MCFQCPSCFSKSRSAHTLSFGPSHIVQQRSTDGSTPVSAQITGETKPRDGVSGTSQLPGSSSSSSAGKSRPVHHGVICDGCNETVAGVRHKCLDCPGMLNGSVRAYSHPDFRFRSLRSLFGIWCNGTTQSVPRVFRYRNSGTCLCSHRLGR